MPFRAVPAALVVVVIVAPSIAHAEWRYDGIGAGMTSGNQTYPAIAQASGGGAIIAWTDTRGSSADIYAQRVDPAGELQFFSLTGVAVCAATGTQSDAAIVSDGSGGAIVTWTDYRSGSSPDVYAQRLTAAGGRLWGPNGIAVCTAAGSQTLPQIVSGDAGGAIIAWTDARSGTDDVYAQRVDPSGSVLWAANGIAISAATGAQSNLRLVADGAGGAVAAWEDRRTGVGSDIYGQRVDASGSTLWTSNGVPLCTVTNDQKNPTVVADGGGGAFVAWQDHRSGIVDDIYVQHVTATGVTLLGAGIAACQIATDQTSPQLVPDGESGVIVVWNDHRSGDWDVYAQHMAATGEITWVQDGVSPCEAGGNQWEPRAAADGAGGALVTWYDQRDGLTNDVYAQRVAASGEVGWMADGVPVCTAAAYQHLPRLVTDTDGAALITWYDNRPVASYADVYAQRIEPRYGAWGTLEPTLDSVSDVPADQGGRVTLRWTASGRDVLNQETISHYTIWRATDPGTVRAGVPLVELDAVGKDFHGPAMRVGESETDPYWELVGVQEAAYRSGYAFTASTTYDSTSAGPAVHDFQVVAHADGDPYVHWPSNVVSGYSVDDLEPAAPLTLAAERVGPDVRLHWTGAIVPDLRDYAVYRATSPGVTPEPVNFLASAGDTMLIDTDAPVSELYYVVTALDVHENESAPSNEAGVATLIGVGDPPSVPALATLGNRPNPFAERTELSIGLPVASDVAIELYDVAGRLVRTLVVPRVAAGWHTIPFDGVDDRGRPLAQGVYYYRVRITGQVTTSRLVIAR